ncbi:MAG: nitrile hydratase accessory protein [Porticoccaceae bacterium]
MNNQMNAKTVNLPFKTLPCSKTEAEGIVFNEPWEARAFGLAIALNQNGLFEWKDWVERFNQQIQLAQAQGDPDLGNTYYNHWLLTLEGVLLDNDLLSLEEIKSREKLVLNEIKNIQNLAV